MVLARVEKRINLSPSLKGKQKAKPEDRFSEVTSDETLAKISKGYVPPNTEKNTGWAMSV